MTSRELYRYTLREVKPSEEAVQNLLRVVDTPSTVKGMNYRLRWAVLLVALLAGAVGCGYAIKAHMTRIQTTEYTYFEEYEHHKQAGLEATDEKLLQVELPRELGYGYVYVNSTYMDQLVADDNGELQDRKMLDVTYAVSGNMAYYEYWGQPQMHLNVGELFEYQKENVAKAPPTDTKIIGDVEVHYTERTVLLVAPGYELAKKDLEQMEEHSSVITSSEVTGGPQLKNATSCYWMLDGYFYELTQYDTQRSREEWYEIAGVLIEAQAEP